MQRVNFSNFRYYFCNDVIVQNIGRSHSYTNNRNTNSCQVSCGKTFLKFYTQGKLIAKIGIMVVDNLSFSPCQNRKSSVLYCHAIMFSLQVILGSYVFDLETDASTTDFYVPFKKIASCSLLLAYVGKTESEFHQINFHYSFVTNI